MKSGTRTYERGCWVIPNLKFLKKKLKNILKNLFFSKKIAIFQNFWKIEKKLQVQIFFAFLQCPPVNIGATMGRSWADHGQTLGDKELVGEKLKFASHQPNACSFSRLCWLPAIERAHVHFEGRAGCQQN